MAGNYSTKDIENADKTRDVTGNEENFELLTVLSSDDLEKNTNSGNNLIQIKSEIIFNWH